MKSSFILSWIFMLLVSCSLNNEMSSSLDLSILSYIEEEKLETTIVTTIYGGEVKEEYKLQEPKMNNKFILVEVSMETYDKEKINMKDFVLKVNDKEFSAIVDNKFLSVYGYKPFSNTDVGISDGVLVFEVDKNIEIVPKNTQLIYKNKTISFEDLAKVKTEDSFFDLSDTNIEYSENFSNEVKIEKYRKKHYDIENPLIILDPYNFAPLTALIMFDTKEEMKVELYIEGKDEKSSIKYDFKEYKKHHEIPIYGLYSNKNNKVILYLEDKSGNKITKESYIKTEELPKDFYTIQLIKSNVDKMEPGFTFISTVGKPFNSIIDNNGDVRWYTNHSSNLIFKRLKNGNIIMNTEKANKFLELDLMGKVYNIYSIMSENIHHDILELENGNFLVTTTDEEGSEDSLIEVERSTGKIIRKYDLEDTLDKNRYLGEGIYKQKFFDMEKNDWFHLNAIYEHKNGITLSGRNQSAVVMVAYPNLELKWILGEHKKWKSEYKKHLLTPINDNGDFEWQHGQHSQMELPDFDNNTDTVDILLFDNGNERRVGIKDDENYSRGVQYRINEKDMTVTQVWEYGKSRGKDLFSASVGDANYLSNTGNRLITFGDLVNSENYDKKMNSSQIVEVTYPESEVVYEVKFNFDDLTRVYRADRDFIYPENYNTDKLKTKTKVFLNEDQNLVEYNEKKPIPKTEYGYIDQIMLNSETKSILLNGWSFLEKYNSDDVEKYLVLYNENRSYEVRLKDTVRKDVTEHFNKTLEFKKNYDKSGFNDEISLTGIIPGKYEVAIKLVHNDTESEYITGYYFTIYGVDNTKLMQNQKVMEENIKKDFESQNYTFENPLVIKNPYGMSPLTALILFNTDTETKVEVEILGKNKESNIKYNLDEVNKSHAIPIYGLYSDKNNTVILSVINNQGKKISKKIKIKTDKVEIDIPKRKILKKDIDKLNKGLIFISSFTGMYAIDLNGDIRWYLKDGIGGVSPVAQLEDDHFLAINNESVRPPYYKSGFYEIDILGKIYKEYKAEGIHHDISRLPSGNYIALVNNPDGDLEDYMIEIDKNTGKVVKTWNMKEIFNIKEKIARPEYVNDEIKKDKKNNNEQILDKYREDWFHQNSVWYDEKTNYLILSSRHQNAVIAIDYNTSEVKWILTGENYDWNDDLANKILKPDVSEFEYTYGQHSAKLINNLLYIYDNGNFRPEVSEEMNYSRGVIFRIDEDEMKVSKVWEFGKENKHETFTPYIGNMEKLGEGYYLINFGGIIIDSDGKITSDVSKNSLPTSKSETRIVEIKDGIEVLIIKLYDKPYISNSYRVNHIEINPKNLLYNFHK